MERLVEQYEIVILCNKLYKEYYGARDPKTTQKQQSMKHILK
jgi:hypothetical protein